MVTSTFTALELCDTSSDSVLLYVPRDNKDC